MVRDRHGSVTERRKALSGCQNRAEQGVDIDRDQMRRWDLHRRDTTTSATRRMYSLQKAKCAVDDMCTGFSADG